MKAMKLVKKKKEAGFTMVELAVVVAIVGVLAAFGIPRFRDSVERSKATEAAAYFAAVRSAQEAYHSRNAKYATSSTQLDIQIPAPKFFTVGSFGPGQTGNIENSWYLTLSRVGASAGYGAYTIVGGEAGFDSGKSSITKLPAINPMN